MAAGHFGSISHVVEGLAKVDPENGPNAPHNLLERAALLESVDLRAAIELYQEVAVRYPGTRVAREAVQNIETLRDAHPELTSEGENC